MKKKILYPLMCLICLISQSTMAAECSNPYNCYYYCHNGWAYDPNEWIMFCSDAPAEWQEVRTGIACEMSGQKRNYCEPLTEEGSNANLR